MRYLLLFAFLLPAIFGLAQSRPEGPRPDGQIRGFVVDSVSRKPLLEATVSLQLARDSSLVSFITTNGEGGFSFRSLPEGRYRLLVTYVGYRNVSRLIAVTRAPAEAITLEMVPQVVNLNEVVIQQERSPITVKQDTIEFNAASFKTRPNAQVEDLLKKLPGIEVSRDGTIKAQGEEVKKVLVDGKPFFGADPKVATRNLPADIIDQIQLFDQQSDQSQFSGVDDGNREKTINLTTRKDRRKGVFGQETLGVGSDGRYNLRLSLNRFSGVRQFSVMGMGNNVNQQGFSPQSLFNGGSGLGANLGGGSFIAGPTGPGGRGGAAGNPAAAPTGITQSWAGGANYRDEWGKKVDVSTSYFFNRTSVLTEQQTRRQNVLPDTSFLTEQSNKSTNITSSHRFNLRLDYRLDSLTTLRLTSAVTAQRSSFDSDNSTRLFTGSDRLFNRSLTDYYSTGQGISGENHLLLLRKFKRKGRTLSLNWNAALNQQATDGFNQSENQFYNRADSLRTDSLRADSLVTQRLNQRNEQRTKSVTNAWTLAYTEPISLNKTLAFHYAYSLNRNTSNRSVADFNEATDQYDRVNQILSNRFFNTFSTNRAGATYQHKRLKYTYAIGFDLQQTTLRSDNRSRNSLLTKSYTNLLPNGLFTYNFARNRTLRVNYRSRINAPSVSQLQPVPDNTNPLNIRLGNPDLKPEFTHSVSVAYNNYQPMTSRSFFLLVNAVQTNDKIVNAASFSEVGAQTTRPVNTDGYYNLSSHLAFGRRISPIKANLNLTTNLNYNRSASLINNRPNRSHAWTLAQGASLHANFTDKLEFSVGGNLSYQTADYSLQAQQNSEFFAKSLTADLYYELPFRMTFTSDLAYNHYSGRSAGYNQAFTLWNLSVGRQLFRNKQGEIRLQVYDLLNQNRSVNRNVTETYVEEVQSRVLNRYFMLQFTYNLRRFGGGGGKLRSGS